MECVTYNGEAHHEGPETRSGMSLDRFLSQELRSASIPWVTCFSATQTYDQSLLVLSVLRQVGTRQELRVDEDLVMEYAILLIVNVFVVQRFVPVLPLHDGQWTVGSVVEVRSEDEALREMEDLRTRTVYSGGRSPDLILIVLLPQRAT